MPNEKMQVNRFCNPRNSVEAYACGFKEVASRQLEAVFYHVSLAEDRMGRVEKLNTQESQMNFIYTALRVQKEASLCKDIASVYAFVKNGS